MKLKDFNNRCCYSWASSSSTEKAETFKLNGAGAIFGIIIPGSKTWQVALKPSELSSSW